MALWFVMTAPALGWGQVERSGCTITGHLSPPSGSSMTWHWYDPDSDWASMTTTIEDAIAEWNGGTGRRNRGYDWTYTHGSNMVLVPMDGYTQVQDYSRAHLNSLGFGTDVTASTVPEYDTPGCVIEEFDVYVIDPDDDYESWTWTSAVSSNASSSEKSLPSIFTHETGHGLSLGGPGSDPHVTELAIMERHHAADIGGKFRLNEDDYSAMVALYGDSSTGKNFMLSKWLSLSSSDRDQDEAWESGSNWVVQRGTTLAEGTVPSESAGPAPIAIIVNGTSSYSVPVEWTISTDTICFDGDDITVGTRTPTISSNTPYIAGPFSGGYAIPSGTATGNYYLCAGIDPDGTLSETDTTDNVIRSERLIQVTP